MVSTGYKLYHNVHSLFFLLTPYPQGKESDIHERRKVRWKLLNFPAELNLAAQVLKDGCLLSRKQMIYWFPIKESTDRNLQNKSLLSAEHLNIGLLKLCSLKSSVGRALQCLLWIPAPALPWPHLGSALCSGVTCRSADMHMASLSRLLRFGISEECQSPLRVFFPFSLYCFSLLSQSRTAWTSRFISSLPRFCEDREEVKQGSFFFKANFIFHFSTLALQFSFSPNLDQRISWIKAKRSICILEFLITLPDEEQQLFWDGYFYLAVWLVCLYLCTCAGTIVTAGVSGDNLVVLQHKKGSWAFSYF